MLFDTWGGVLTPAQYAEFSLRYMAQIVDALTRRGRGPSRAEHRVHQGRRRLACDIAAIGCDAVGVDWTTDLATARRAVGERRGAAGEPRPFRSVRAA